MVNLVVTRPKQPCLFREIQVIITKKGEKLIINKMLKNFAADWK